MSLPEVVEIEARTSGPVRRTGTRRCPVEDRDDVRVVQRHGDPRLAHRPLHERLRWLVGQADLLQRHLTADQLGTRPSSIVRNLVLDTIPPSIFPAESLTVRRSTSKHE
jgi:hypothetical protein